jgi:TolB-like protein/Tfp pilus assembly protein PilF
VVKEPAPARSIPRSHGLPPRSIAILPFVNLTSDPANEYIGDGLADELINTLTRAPSWFKVPARTSTFAYKGRQTDVRQIARDLDVEAVLEGSVREVDGRIRIVVQLIDGRTGYHHWSREFECLLENLGELERELMITVADVLMLGGTDFCRALRSAPTRDLQAYHLLLQSKALTWQPTERNLERALGALSQAIERDPFFARAWQARAAVRGYYFTLDNPLPDVLRDAESDARHALTLDPELHSVHTVLGCIAACRGDWVGAEARMRTAQSRLPHDPEVLAVHALFVAQSVGQVRRSLQEAERASELAPLSPVITFNVAVARLMLGHTDEARRWIGLALDKGMPQHLELVADVLAAIDIRDGHYETAAERTLRTLPPVWLDAGGAEVVRAVHAALANPLQSAGAIAALTDLAKRVPASALNQRVYKRLIKWYTLLGALDSAYAVVNRALDSAAAAGMVGTAWGILWMPELKTFRRDHRFQALTERLGLPAYWRQYGQPD